jgi:hypothetical protein
MAMSYKDLLKDWVRDALGSVGGEGSINDVAKYVWDNHESELRDSGEHFYTWQYDLRWAAQELRNKSKLSVRRVGRRSIWTLK